MPNTGFRGPVRFGAPALGDVPMPADYDGDGRADLAVYRITTGQWFVFGSATGFAGPIQFGSPAYADLPAGQAPPRRSVLAPSGVAFVEQFYKPSHKL